MLGVDTNILVRFFTRDDPRQYEQAVRLVDGADDGELFVGPVVLVELYWVLRRSYGLNRSRVFALLDDLLEFREFTVGAADFVRHALANARELRCEFPDALIGLLHVDSGCEHTATFDKRAQRLETMIAVEALL